VLEAAVVQVPRAWRVALTRQASSFSSCACRPRSALSGRAWRRRFFGRVRSDVARVLHAPSLRRSSLPTPLPATFLGFSAFVLYFLLFLCTVCLCVAQVLLEFSSWGALCNFSEI